MPFICCKHTVFLICCKHTVTVSLNMLWRNAHALACLFAPLSSNPVTPIGKADEDLRNILHLCAAMIGRTGLRIGYQSCWYIKQQRSTSGFEAVRKRLLWKSRPFPAYCRRSKDAARKPNTVGLACSLCCVHYPDRAGFCMLL